MSFFSLFGAPDPSTLTAAAFKERLQPGDPVLDVRTPAEYGQGHLKDARNIDVTAADFKDRIEKLMNSGTLSTDHPVYLYCRSGNRSGQAVRTLRAMGFKEAYNVGGLNQLAQAGLPLAR